MAGAIRTPKRDTQRRRKATSRNHSARRRRSAQRVARRVGSRSLGPAELRQIEIPRDVGETGIEAGGGRVHLTNLQKVFWPELGLTKRDLLQYYLDVSRWLLPHVKNRAMVMKRYPNGVHGPFFFMKRAPQPRPDFIPICSIEHASGNVIGFPVIQDVASLLWVINLGCIDLNPWYARCDDVWRPDFLHFDLDPTPETPFERVLETALIVRDVLAELKIKSYAKTTGSRGMHIYIPIVRGPDQKNVWRFAKAFSQELARRHPQTITAEYRVAKRPTGHVLADYNQNAWGRTLASVYSVRPTINATVSTPVSWDEVERGIRIEDFTTKNVPARLKKLGDLWAPLLEARKRVRLEAFL